MKKIIYSKDLFARNLKELMRKYNLKQKDIENATGISQSTICRYLAGLVTATRVNISTLAGFFGVTCEWLVGQEQLDDMPTRLDAPQTADNSLSAKNPLVVKNEQHSMHDAIDKIITSDDASTILALEVNINMFLEKVKEKQDKKKLKNRLKRIEKEIEISKQSRAVGADSDGE